MTIAAAGRIRPSDQIRAASGRTDIGEEAIDVTAQRCGLPAELLG
jgi:hypothetical protein